MKEKNKSKSDSTTSPVMKKFINESDRAPCYYATIEKAEKRKDWGWIVGCKNDGENQEYTFKFAKLGNMNNDDTFTSVTELSFATELIKIFRNGGETALKNWIKNISKDIKASNNILK